MNGTIIFLVGLALVVISLCTLLLVLSNLTIKDRRERLERHIERSKKRDEELMKEILEGNKQNEAIAHAKTHVCPKCKTDLQMAQNTKMGQFVQCSKTNWDKDQKKNLGCDFVLILKSKLSKETFDFDFAKQLFSKQGEWFQSPVKDSQWSYRLNNEPEDGKYWLGVKIDRHTKILGAF